MDIAKNLPVPNNSTNDDYYKRQFPVFSFNIHILLTTQRIFCTYPETNGRKGSDEVCTMECLLKLCRNPTARKYFSTLEHSRKVKDKDFVTKSQGVRGEKKMFEVILYFLNKI